MAKYNVYSILGEKKLAHHQGCQCKVREREDGIIEFISYSTVVIIAKPADKYSPEGKNIYTPVDCEYPDRYYLECTGTYSPTTRRQIGYFLKEYFGDVNYYHMKDIAGSKDTVVLAQKKHARYW